VCIDAGKSEAGRQVASRTCEGLAQAIERAIGRRFDVAAGFDHLVGEVPFCYRCGL